MEVTNPARLLLSWQTKSLFCLSKFKTACLFPMVGLQKQFCMWKIWDWKLYYMSRIYMSSLIYLTFLGLEKKLKHTKETLCSTKDNSSNSEWIFCPGTCSLIIGTFGCNNSWFKEKCLTFFLLIFKRTFNELELR